MIAFVITIIDVDERHYLQQQQQQQQYDSYLYSFNSRATATAPLQFLSPSLVAPTSAPACSSSFTASAISSSSASGRVFCRLQGYTRSGVQWKLCKTLDSRASSSGV
jgi:hypothetical protein